VTAIRPLVVRWREALRADTDLSWKGTNVGVMLSTWMAADGRGAFPSVPTIAASMKLSESTVQRGLRELEERGYLWSGVTPGKPTRYDALLPPTGVPQTPVPQTPPLEPASHSVEGVSESAATGVHGTPEVEVPELEHEQDARVRARGSLDRKEPDPDVLLLLDRARRGEFAPLVDPRGDDERRAVGSRSELLDDRLGSADFDLVADSRHLVDVRPGRADARVTVDGDPEHDVDEHRQESTT
jgi:hypothetical protein